MEKQNVITVIEDLLEFDAGELKGDERLDDVAWDSITFMGFIAIADEKFGVVISPSDLTNCQSIDDLVKLVQSQADKD